MHRSARSGAARRSWTRTASCTPSPRCCTSRSLRSRAGPRAPERLAPLTSSHVPIPARRGQVLRRNGARRARPTGSSRGVGRHRAVVTLHQDAAAVAAAVVAPVVDDLDPAVVPPLDAGAPAAGDLADAAGVL